jgi:hypothetical protein
MANAAGPPLEQDLDFDSLGADDVELEPSNTRASGSRPSSDVGRAVTD